MEEQTDRHTDWLKSLCTADVEKVCMDLSIQSNGMAAFRNIPMHTVFTGVYCQKEKKKTYILSIHQCISPLCKIPSQETCFDWGVNMDEVAPPPPIKCDLEFVLLCCWLLWLTN